MSNKRPTQMPEQIKYYIRQMQDSGTNSGIRIQYKTTLIDIVNEIQKEIAHFDKNSVFNQRK